MYVFMHVHTYIGGKPWSNTSPTSAKDFYAAKSTWLSTWGYSNGQVSDSAALQIDSVKVWSFPSISSHTYHGNYKGPTGVLIRDDMVHDSKVPTASPHSMVLVAAAMACIVALVVGGIFGYSRGRKHGNEEARRGLLNN
jgi:hypothetical protein